MSKKKLFLLLCVALALLVSACGGRPASENKAKVCTFDLDFQVINLGAVVREFSIQGLSAELNDGFLAPIQEDEWTRKFQELNTYLAEVNQAIASLYPRGVPSVFVGGENEFLHWESHSIKWDEQNCPGRVQQTLLLQEFDSSVCSEEICSKSTMSLQGDYVSVDLTNNENRVFYRYPAVWLEYVLVGTWDGIQLHDFATIPVEVVDKERLYPPLVSVELFVDEPGAWNFFYSTINTAVSVAYSQSDQLQMFGGFQSFVLTNGEYSGSWSLDGWQGLSFGGIEGDGSSFADLDQEFVRILLIDIFPPR